MNNTVLVKTPNLKLKVILGVSGILALLILAWMFQYAAMYVIVGFATVGMAGYGVKVWFKYQTNQHLLRREKAETGILEQKWEQEKIITIQLERHAQIFETKSGVFFYGNDRQWKLIPATATERKQLLPQIIEQSATLPNLLDEIRNEQCVMFLGPRDSGKTTLALHWLSVRDTQAVVCDVKGFNPWPNNCQVVSEVDQIIKASQSVLNEMNHRRENQITHEQSITLFFDELHYLVSEGVEVVQIALAIATMGREFGIHSAFTSHGDTAKYLGVDSAKLLANFTRVRVTKKHQTYLDFGEGEQEVINPGPYNQTIPKQYPDILHVPTTEGELIEQAILKGNSNYKIAKEIFGYANGEIYKKIDVIRENSIID